MKMNILILMIMMNLTKSDSIRGIRDYISEYSPSSMSLGPVHASEPLSIEFGCWPGVCVF